MYRGEDKSRRRGIRASDVRAVGYEQAHQIEMSLGDTPRVSQDNNNPREQRLVAIAASVIRVATALDPLAHRCHIACRRSIQYWLWYDHSAERLAADRRAEAMSTASMSSSNPSKRRAL